MLKLEALDTLFFRDGKPFNKEGDNWVHCLFPPAPSVFYGALRSLYFAHNIEQFSKANKEDDPTNNLKINGIFVECGDSVYFPFPLDLVKGKGNDEVFPLMLEKRKFVSNCPTEFILRGPEDEEVETTEGGLLDDLSLKRYLSGDNQGFLFRSLSDFITSEPTVGIQINSSKGVAQEGLLFRVGMIRPEVRYSSGRKIRKLKTRKAKILVDYEGLSLPSRGIMKVGGESRAMFYEHCEKEEIRGLNIDYSGMEGDRFKVYLATPAKFTKGWIPDWIDEETLIGTYNGISLKLLTAVIGKYVHIGGFDMKNKKPKPMLRAVPAGSVYYFEILDGGNLSEAMASFHFSTISDFDAKQGFGLAFVGRVQ